MRVVGLCSRVRFESLLASTIVDRQRKTTIEFDVRLRGACILALDSFCALISQRRRQRFHSVALYRPVDSRTVVRQIDLVFCFFFERLGRPAALVAPKDGGLHDWSRIQSKAASPATAEELLWPVTRAGNPAYYAILREG